MQLRCNAASADLDRIEKYIAEENPLAAINQVIMILDHAEELLPTHSEIGRKGRRHGTRELVIVGTPFLVVYQVEEKMISILRVLHGAQQWPKAES